MYLLYAKIKKYQNLTVFAQCVWQKEASDKLFVFYYGRRKQVTLLWQREASSTTFMAKGSRQL
jgi:hypothetical protein